MIGYESHSLPPHPIVPITLVAVDAGSRLTFGPNTVLPAEATRVKRPLKLPRCSLMSTLLLVFTSMNLAYWGGRRCVMEVGGCWSVLEREYVCM